MNVTGARSLYASEFAQSFYGLVWRWLKEGAPTQAQELFSRLERANLQELRDGLSPQDSRSVCNALRWLGLFLPEADPRLKALIWSLDSREYPEQEWQSFEKTFIDWLWALRSRNRQESEALRRRLSEEPLHADPNNPLLALIGAIEGQPELEKRLASLARELKEMIEPEDRGAFPLIVDCRAVQLVISGGARVIRSRPLCEIMKALRHKGSLSFEEVAWISYGHSHFDFSYHAPKIYNFISRLKHILPPNARLVSKEARLYFDGDWSMVLFREHASRAAQLRELDWKRLFLTVDNARKLECRPNIRPGMIVRALREHGSLTRIQLERFTGKSKSTVHRTLQKLIEDGQIGKNGSGVNTLYFVKTVDTDSRSSAPPADEGGSPVL